MHPARPRAETLPCPSCGKDVDALRASRVVLLESGTRYLCSASCATDFRQGSREHETTPPPARTTSVPQQVREATMPRIALQSRENETAARRAIVAPQPVPIPWSGILLAAAGFGLGLAAQSWPLALVSLACTTLASIVALIRGAGARADVGAVAWVAGPLGATLAAIAGMLAFLELQQNAGLAGAAIAALAMVARSWLDRRARQPVAEVVHELASSFPTRARIPTKEEHARYEEVQVSTLRVGSEILVIEGETVAVDGVVVSGEASVLIHPTAGTPARIKAGMRVLAGAKVTDGALRIMASRVGDERALKRPVRYGDVHGPQAARIARLADRVTRYGGLIALAAAPLGLALTGDPGLWGSLSAAAAVLLAAPLLAARRGAESPFVAAAASAGSRGIIYQDARSMESAGRVTTAALCASGVITEGNPEVVGVFPVGDADVSELISMIAGAEAKMETHPLARALIRYAHARSIAPVLVRRATRIAGRGTTAITQDGVALVVGTRQLLLDEGISIAMADALAKRAEERGQTALFVGLGGRVRAVISLQDPVRLGSRAAVQRIFDLGIEVVLLSGDHRATVASLAAPLDVNNVKADLVPSEQQEAVRRLRDSGGLVAAAGRLPLNALPLEAADVPILLDYAGLPEGERGVAIAGVDVRDAAAALWIARAARKEATRGVALAVGAGGMLVAGAALGWVVPAAAAVIAVGVDAFALPAGARLLRRIELRLPSR